MDDAVGLAGAVAPGADQAVEFLAQGGELLARDQWGGRGGLSGAGLGGAGLGGAGLGGVGIAGAGGELGLLALAEQGPDLVGFEQAGQAEEVLLLRRPGRGGGAELAAVVEDPVEVDRGVEGLEGGLVQLVRACLVRAGPRLVRPPRAPHQCWMQARGPVRPPIRRRTRAGPVPRAGTPKPSPPACAPGRSGLRPGRSTARWTRWWRTRRRPGGGCRRPRRPSARRPSSARRSRRTRRSSLLLLGRPTAPRPGACRSGRAAARRTRARRRDRPR